MDDPTRAGPLTTSGESGPPIASRSAPPRGREAALPGSGEAARAAAFLRIPDRLDASLVLVRHGESELIVQQRFQGQLETPLSPTGRRQAALVGRRLARPLDPPALPLPVGPPLSIVYSPLGRAAETASAIGDAIRSPLPDGLGTTVPVRPDERLLEIAQGQWEGRLAADIRAEDGDRLRAWRQHPTEAWAPGGERLVDVQARVAPALSDLLAELAEVGEPGTLDAPQVGGYDGPTTHPWSIVVGHDGVFKIVLLTLFDLPLERFWMWSTDLGGMTIVEFRAGRPVIRAANLTDHLGGLLDEAAQAALEERAESGAL